MRIQVILILLVAASVGLGCDGSTSPHLAALGGGQEAGDSTAALVISPAEVQTSIGGTVQLSTNAPAELTSQLQWTSGAQAVASVNQAGLVTALGTGVATITVRYATDTTNHASATIDVAPPVTQP